jgi:acyl-[acyl-carrier-protein]-phospholipid O-acyltransferase/long-chain-fatty-acid--[acyl-carrier-protein] ligase
MVAKYKATILISTPTFYAAYIRRIQPEQFSSIRYAIVGAEKLRESLAKDFKEKYGRDLLEGYGCTETAPVVSVNIPDVEEASEHQTGLKPGTVGHPIPGVAVKVVDTETGETLSSGREGLLLVKGPNRMLGYLGEPELTKKVFRDGWYVTGDIASIDDDGFIRITDRLSRFSKIGGEMVPHIKVEDLLQDLAGASEQAFVVTAIPDEKKGERLIVLHTLDEPQLEECLEKLGNSDLPALWRPRPDQFLRIEKLPYLGTGKLDLRKARELALEKGQRAVRD